MPTDRMSGRPRGFAFVNYADAAAAGEAIRRFNDFEFKGRKLRVNEAQERPPRMPNFGGGGFGQPDFRKWGKPKGSRKGLRARKRGGF